MFDCARFYGITMKKSKKVVRVLEVVVRIVGTLLEEGVGRGWFLGCWVPDCAYECFAC